MSETVHYARRGDIHRTLPPAVPEWATSPRYFVVSWHCPQCEQLVAETVVQPGDSIRTVIECGPVTHMAAGDRDGLRYFGPSMREMRGKTPRRSSTRLQRGALMRRSPDYAPVEDSEFDTLCANCPLRLRISVPRV